MVGVIHKRIMRVAAVALIALLGSGCVSTNELYAEYDAFDCLLVATKSETGAVNLHEQNTNTHYPWEPAVYFELDSSELSSADQARLNRSMKILNQFPTLVLGLQGFTDERGTDGYNAELAMRRVQAVKAYLQSQGVASGRVVLQPIGEVLPQIDSDQSIAYSVNRRVELMLLDRAGRPIPLNYSMNVNAANATASN